MLLQWTENFQFTTCLLGFQWKFKTFSNDYQKLEKRGEKTQISSSGLADGVCVCLCHLCTQYAHMDQGALVFFLYESSSSWIRRFLIYCSPKLPLWKTEQERMASLRRCMFTSKQVLYYNSTYADWYFSMKSIRYGKGRGAVWIFLFCFDMVINPYRLYGRGTKDKMTKTDAQLLRHRQLFRMVFDFFSLFCYKMTGKSHQMYFQKKITAATV